MCNIICFASSTVSSCIEANNLLLGLKTFSQATLADSISVRILKNALLNSDCYLRDDDIQRLIINALNFLKSMGDSQWVASSSSLTTQPEIAAFEAFFEILVMLTSKSNESMRAQAHKALFKFQSWQVATKRRGHDSL